MTDRQSQLPPRPWTPGPWRERIGRNDVLAEGEIVGADGIECCWIMNHGDLAGEAATSTSAQTPGLKVGEANIALILLAPEMAEAILMWKEAPDVKATFNALNSVANKIRKIGT